MRINKAIQILSRRAKVLQDRTKNNPRLTYDIEEKKAILKMIDVYVKIMNENNLYRSLLNIKEKAEEAFEDYEEQDS